MNTSIPAMIMYFVGYILIHSLIGLKLEKVKKELEEKPGNEELMNLGRKLKKAFAWFPAIYLVVIIIMFYFF